ncbi:MAG: single-stranded-DNA-specific exonuclease RecJ [Ostreibacterium sp.]
MSVTQLRNNPTPLNLDSYPNDFSPCHRRVLSARQIAPEQLKKSLNYLLDVEQLCDVSIAAERLYQAIQHQEKIVIVGDYDADGATAMSVLLSVLHYLSANVDTVVPNRETMGYGLSDAAVAKVLAKKARLVITVDTGISAIKSVATLKQHGMAVIITDHHLPPENLPSADAIVNPNRKDCHFPDKALAGVGVAFYLVLALRQGFRRHKDKRLADYPIVDLLPLVAIGTVADCVPLSFNNRILVEQGLKRLRIGKGSAGIRSLLNVAELVAEHLTSTDIAFQIAPRLNAAGRIADMQLGVDCLMTNNERLAFDYAMELDRLNKERKSIENEMRLEADCIIAEQIASEIVLKNDYSLCLFEAHWHEGVIGILASRLKEKYGKTVFVFSQSSMGLKASARSSDGVNVIDALNAVNSYNPNLIENYGGHAKAAGLMLREINLSEFSRKIEIEIAQQLSGKMIDESIFTDGELLPYELSIDNAEFIKKLEPWGMQVPEPLFNNVFYIDSMKEVGKNHAQIVLIEKNSGLQFKGIAFDKFANYHIFIHEHCRVAYHLSVNRWRGKRSLALQVSYIEKLEEYS